MFDSFSIDTVRSIPIEDENYPWEGIFGEDSYTMDEVLRVRAAMLGMHIGGEPNLHLPVYPEELGFGRPDNILAGACRFMLFRIFFLTLGEMPLEFLVGLDRADNEDSLHVWASFEAACKVGLEPGLLSNNDGWNSWRTGPSPTVPAELAATRAGANVLEDWQEHMGRALALSVLRNGFAPMIDSWDGFVPMLNREWIRYANAIRFPD